MNSELVIKPPMARKKNYKRVMHGEEITDNYFWLRERHNSEVIDYLSAENNYADKIMKETTVLQKSLFDEIKGRIKETDDSVLEPSGDFYYFSRDIEGKQYKKYYRKQRNSNEEEILLDLNELAIGHDYLKLGLFKISPSHKLLAYSIDIEGSEKFTIFIKNLETGELLEERIKNTYPMGEWANDNETFFYITLDEQIRPFELFYHKVNSSSKKDLSVLCENDKAFFMEIKKTRDSEFLIITLKSKTTSEAYYLNPNRPEEEPTLIHPREHEMEYFVDHQNQQFIIRTNENAQNYKIMKTLIERTTKENWEEIIPYDERIFLVDFEVFKDFLILFERKEGLRAIRVINLVTKEEYYISFTEEVYTCWKQYWSELLVLPEFETNLLRFNYSSLIIPESVIEFNLKTKERKTLKQEEILGGYNSSDYKNERISVTASDGETIYISLVYKKDIEKNSNNPLLLIGYGSYGISLDPTFLAPRVSLLNRGIICALAHVRGGSERGRQWYIDGKLLNKKNTFLDFVTCAEQLSAENYTSREKLAIMGGSAGGLLMGAVTNMRPDLFKVVVAHVPFVDVINTMSDETIPLTVTEFEEWGNPKEKQFYDYMKSYSPYDNVEVKDYPHLLVMAGLNDPRVQYWEPAKWVAKLRSMNTDNKNILLLQTNMSEGHQGKSGRYDAIKETALYYAFIVRYLGIE